MKPELLSHITYPMRPGSQTFMHNPYMNPSTKPNEETGALHLPNAEKTFYNGSLTLNPSQKPMCYIFKEKKEESVLYVEK